MGAHLAKQRSQHRLKSRNINSSSGPGGSRIKRIHSGECLDESLRCVWTVDFEDGCSEVHGRDAIMEQLNRQKKGFSDVYYDKENEVAKMFWKKVRENEKKKLLYHEI